jgi:hypothetical protein
VRDVRVIGTGPLGDVDVLVVAPSLGVIVLVEVKANRLRDIRDPEGILIGLAEQIG